MIFVFLFFMKKSMLEVIIFLEILFFVYIIFILSLNFSVMYLIVLIVIAVCEGVVGLTLIIKHEKKKKTNSLKSLNLIQF